MNAEYEQEYSPNEQARNRRRSARKIRQSAEAYRRRELIEEQRLLADQIADFWEPRHVENRPVQDIQLLR